MSVVLGIDSDINTDISSDFEIGDLLSFKGLIHFGIGYSWWMVIHSGNTSWTTHAIAFLLGSLVMVILWLTYWMVSKLKKEVIPEIGKELIGKTCEIYTKNPYTGEYSVLIESNGALREISGVRVLSGNESGVVPGQRFIIKDYIDGKYYIN
jgi:hypothetical protein